MFEFASWLLLLDLVYFVEDGFSIFSLILSFSLLVSSVLALSLVCTVISSWIMMDLDVVVFGFFGVRRILWFGGSDWGGSRHHPDIEHAEVTVWIEMINERAIKKERWKIRINTKYSIDSDCLSESWGRIGKMPTIKYLLLRVPDQKCIPALHSEFGLSPCGIIVFSIIG